MTNNEVVTPIDLAARPHSVFRKMIPPDTKLLCRMIRESGALIVLAKKILSPKRHVASPGLPQPKKKQKIECT